MADFYADQGDTAITWKDTLTYSDGTTVDVTGGSVKFVMRALTSNAVKTNLAATVTNNTAPCTVSYKPTAQDTDTPGQYMARWHVTFADATTEQFPTVGYLTVEIGQNLTTAGGAAIVSLGDVKSRLNIAANDRSHDSELLAFIDGVTPVIENICGPILQHTYTEIHDGGTVEIITRHRPILEVESVVEYRGPIAYTLTQVATPDLGTIYSYTFEPEGRILRRSVGGAATAFPGGKGQVVITYTAGYSQVPANVREATLELIRVNYQQTQQADWRSGGGAFPQADELVGQQLLGFFVPNRVRELLSPSRRFPSLA